VDKRLELMIESLFLSLGKDSKGTDLHSWIGGYAYGRTKEHNDPFLYLYNPTVGMEEKVCRVYEKDFPKMPNFVDTNVPDMPGRKENPSKQVLIESGRYIECPRFEIIMFLGRETNLGPEKRFLGVSRVSRQSVQEWEALQQDKAKEAAATSQPKQVRKPVATPLPMSGVKGLHDMVSAVLGDQAKTMLTWAWDQGKFETKTQVLDELNEQALRIIQTAKGADFAYLRSTWIDYVKAKEQLTDKAFKTIAEAMYERGKIYDSAYALSRIFTNLEVQGIQSHLTGAKAENVEFDKAYEGFEFEAMERPHV